VIGPFVAYRRWACDVPEGVARRDWRLHPIRLYRHRRFMAQVRPRDAVRDVAREILGLAPRARGYVHPDRPWGHGYYDLWGA
jgi:hypothetical protein